ncbi:hypothetical protein BLNAU_6402 [Blattamonas nauphoetae]|uniref:Right handed beta helix domain-containing protein n=1 Tax=Blattamonas nauphoetae TaxID=2049346 RepID=A0ABQ9Y4G4_9EUKA|nr:hypothetical protein BLNAU_6402 [Blattamonas nauphoetae]
MQASAHDINVTGCTFNGCSAINGNGGAISSPGIVKIQNSVFLSCSSKYIGGAAYFALMDTGRIAIMRCVLRHCSADTGGCMFFSSTHTPEDWNDGAIIAMSHTSCEESTAMFGGGAISMTAFPIHIVLCSFVDTRADFGGAIDIAAMGTSIQVRLNNLLFSECVAIHNATCVSVYTVDDKKWLLASALNSCVTTALEGTFAPILYYTTPKAESFVECPQLISTISGSIEVKMDRKDSINCWGVNNPCSTVSRAILRVAPAHTSLFEIAVQSGEYQEWGWAVGTRNITVTGYTPTETPLSMVHSVEPNNDTKVIVSPRQYPLNVTSTAYLHSTDAFIVITTGQLVINNIYFDFTQSAELIKTKLASFAQIDGVDWLDPVTTPVPTLILNHTHLLRSISDLSGSVIFLVYATLKINNSTVSSVRSAGPLIKGSKERVNIAIFNSSFDCAIKKGSLIAVDLRSLEEHELVSSIHISSSNLTCDSETDMASPVFLSVIASNMSERTSTLNHLTSISQSRFIGRTISRQTSNFGSLLLLQDSHVTITDSTFSGSTITAPQRRSFLNPNSNDANTCVWSSSLIHLENCQSTIERIILANSTSGGIGFEHGQATILSATFINNSRINSDTKFNDRRKNIYCQDAELTLTHIDVETYSPVDRTSIADNLWVYNYNCTVDIPSTSKLPASIYFTPKLITAKWKIINITHFQIDLTGESMFPCLLSIEVDMKVGSLSKTIEFPITEHTSSKQATTVTSIDTLSLSSNTANISLLYPLGRTGMRDEDLVRAKKGQTPKIPILRDDQQKATVSNVIVIVLPAFIVSVSIGAVLFVIALVVKGWLRKKDHQQHHDDRSIPETDSLIPPGRQEGTIRKYVYSTQST